MSNAELDRTTALHAAGKTPVEVHALLQRTRAARGLPGPDLTTVRRALRGATGKRARVEARGRKAKVTIVKLRALDAARRRLIQRAKGETEVHIEDVMKAARVTDVSPPTVSKHFKKHLGVNWRSPREAPWKPRGRGGGGLGPGRFLAETFPMRGAPRLCPGLLAGLAASARPAPSFGRLYFLYSCR